MASKEKTKTNRPSDVVGIDFGATSTKLVRVKRQGSLLNLVDADVMPSFDFSDPAASRKLALSKKLSAPYAAAAVTGAESHVRFMFVSSKLQDNRGIQQRVAKSLGLGADYRVSYSVVDRGKEGVDHKVLAAGVPLQEVQAIRRLFASNKPSLVSMEVSGLAALNSFSSTDAVKKSEGIVCYMEAGAAATIISFFLNGELRLVRKFDHGANHILSRIQDVLNISEDDALTVLFEDATSLMDQALDPIGAMLQEISISRKFVERNENAAIHAVYASGGLSYSPYWVHMMREVMGAEVEVWNPFTANGIKNLPKGVLGVESMFAPALGAAMALLREDA